MLYITPSSRGHAGISTDPSQKSCASMHAIAARARRAPPPPFSLSSITYETGAPRTYIYTSRAKIILFARANLSIITWLSGPHPAHYIHPYENSRKFATHTHTRYTRASWIIDDSTFSISAAHGAFAQQRSAREKSGGGAGVRAKNGSERANRPMGNIRDGNYNLSGWAALSLSLLLQLAFAKLTSFFARPRREKFASFTTTLYT